MFGSTENVREIPGYPSVNSSKELNNTCDAPIWNLADILILIMDNKYLLIPIANQI